MITKTLNLDQAYQKLFDDVRTESNGQYSFDNLEAFYGSIEEVAQINPKFLRLPLDEPLFEIDANTRKITVPAEFRANGVSVQRDHLAEIIYFRIARFFDYTDLSTCEIVINWKMGAKEGKTTRFVQFAEPYTVVDVEGETQLNGIVFGWPINDVATEKSGQLTFAIEFFKKAVNPDTNEEEIIYRFNTLPTTVNIKDGLVIGDNVAVYELDNDIIRTLRNSPFGEDTAAVGPIVWLTGDGDGLVLGEGTENHVILQDFTPIVNLRTSIDDSGKPHSTTAVFYAQGFVDTGTRIRYTDINNNEPIIDMLKVFRPRVEAEYEANSGKKYYAGTLEDEPLTDEAAAEAESLWVDGDLIEGLKYYVEDPEDSSSYIEASEEEIAAWGTTDAVDLFIQVAKISVSEAGSYAIKGQGYKVDNEGHKIGNGEVKSTSIVTVPQVEAPSVIELTTSERPTADAGYSYDEDVANVVFLDNNNEGTIFANAVLQNYGAMQFVWQKKVGDDAHGQPIFADISDSDVPFKVDVIVNDEEVPANQDSLSVTAPGAYRVQVTSFLNGAKIEEPVVSDVVTASILAGKILSATAVYKRNNGAFAAIEGDIRYQANGNIIPKITLKVADLEQEDIQGQRGELQYQWFEQISSFEGEEEVISLVPIEENANGQEYLVPTGHSGYFVPKVMNNYNGSVYTYTLPVINVANTSSN